VSQAGPPLVGIIANPASGKDIRRLVAHGSTFDNNEKINIVRRVLLGLDALRVDAVRYMPDTYGIVPRAAEHLVLDLDLQPLRMPVLENAGDSLEAARRLRDLGARGIVTLGGDGTNRMVAKGCGDVPLVPISTGTNNVFPRMVEGTLAGLGAALLATGAVALETCVRREPRLDVSVDGELRDMALIDVATSRLGWIGARALWEPGHLQEVVVSRITANQIGLCSLGGMLFPGLIGSEIGTHVVVGESKGGRSVLVPIAPGVVRSVPIASVTTLEPGQTVELARGACVVALDGEREIEIPRAGPVVTVVLNRNGPRVLGLDAALAEGAAVGAFAVG